jgi:hypothetical protein
MFKIAQDMKDCLSGIDGVNTVKIGIETALSPVDYPLIRIVPTKKEHGSAFPRESLSVDVFFGYPTTQADVSLEAVYGQIDIMERVIIGCLETCSCFTAVFQGTEYDQDQVAGYKLAVSKFTVSS